MGSGLLFGSFLFGRHGFWRAEGRRVRSELKIMGGDFLILSAAALRKYFMRNSVFKRIRCIIKAMKEGDILNTTDQTHQQDLERLKSLRYMDDDFMSVCLADNFEGVELILRIISGQEDIKIKSVRTQEPLKNLQGRSAVLDVHAADSTDKEFDVEIQKKDAGAKRARHNSSLLDAHILKPGDDTENIPDSYVIFITENDVMKGKQPIYPAERYVTIGESKVLFGDGSHILYVNGKYRGNDEIRKLMHDFSCTNPNDMNYEALAEKARYFKQDEELQPCVNLWKI
nr:hypothetical protein [uncultured Acetatifactor sp.]